MQLRVSVRGVPVFVEPSWYLTLGIIAAGFALSLHVLLPEFPLPVAALLGAKVALAVTLSLLAHEFAHAITARDAGVGIEYIRLFAGGALCRRREPIGQARDQFRVAVAGPLASAAIGLIALLAAVVVEIAGLPSALSAALWFVAFANVVVAFSNMLPVFPFDGAKAVHAMFWRSTGDRAEATRRLRRSGREFSQIVIFMGLLLVGWTGDAVIGLSVAAFGLYLLRLPKPPI